MHKHILIQACQRLHVLWWCARFGARQGCCPLHVDAFCGAMLPSPPPPHTQKSSRYKTQSTEPHLNSEGTPPAFMQCPQTQDMCMRCSLTSVKVVGSCRVPRSPFRAPDRAGLPVMMGRAQTDGYKCPPLRIGHRGGVCACVPFRLSGYAGWYFWV